MSVEALNQPLLPTGITGPPDIFFGRVSQTGDASGGNLEISFDLDAGFLWMILQASTDGSAAVPTEVRIQNADDAVPGGQGWTHSYTPVNAFASELVPFPRMLIRPVRRNAQVDFRVTNSNGLVLSVYVRALRWPKSAPPEAWLAFLVVPP